MKFKDQLSLEEAYIKINESEVKASPTSAIDPETTQHYFNALKKFENGEITSQQWYDICTKLLGDIMEQNKDVFIRLKNR
jgi:hypothetical protein